MPPLPPPSPWLIQGFQSLERGDAVTAERYFRQGLMIRRGDPQALQGLGLTLIRQGRQGEARQPLEQAAAALPKDAGCAANLGALLIELGDHPAAEAHLRRATRVQPGMAAAWNNLGRVLMHLGRLDEAETVLRKALTLNPEYGQCRENWRETQDIRLHQLELAGQYTKALEEADKTLQLDPTWDKARYFRACNLLRLQRFSAGWADYRTLYDDVQSVPLPEWQGAPLPETETLLIRAEQGVGEQIMLASLIERARSRCPRIIAECDERMVSLMARSLPAITWVPWTNPANAALHDPSLTHQIGLGRLPSLFLPDRAAFGDGAAILVPDPARLATIKAGLTGDKPLVGLAWASGRSPAATRKIIPVAALRPLLGAVPARFVVLQYEPAAEDLAQLRSWGVDVVDCPVDPMRDLDGFAATLAACDHVVTTSNATAHFAGALGVPASVLLSASPLWHWFIEDSTSPWYNSLHLYRQDYGAAWDRAVAAVTADLAARLPQA